MNLHQIKQDQRYSHRTQISLSKSMFLQLMQEKGDTSLAEHMRSIILQHWEQEEERQQQVAAVIEKLKQPMPKPAPSVEELLKWEREIRKDRLENETK